MIIMVLDHTRDFFHFDAFLHEPLDPATSTPVLYFTRWVTHFCAPVFVFLAGVSIYLQALRKPANELSLFLFKRGLWLVFVEVFIITFGWTFDFSFSVFILGVIWAIGISMICMAALIRLPYQQILVLGMIIVLGHNVFDSLEFSHSGFLWDLTRNGNFAFHPLPGGSQVAIVYPFVPWLGLMMIGYCFGRLYSAAIEPGRRKKVLIRAGFGLIATFFLIRWLNIYGDPDPWSSQHSGIATLMSFFDVHKYPPSLLYMCITIGPALLFLAFFESSSGKVSRVVQVFGRVPFLFYVLHLFALHVLCMLFFIYRGHPITEQTPDIFGIPFNFVLIGEGYSLSIVYLIWALLVIALYPVCSWFSNLKAVSKSGWLSYL